MKEGYFYLIPAKLAENVKAKKALLFGVISSLANKEGFCWASNKFLADKLGVKSTETISRYISELVEGGWIKRELKNNNKRRLTPLFSKSSPLDSKINTPCSQNQHSNINSNKKEYKEKKLNKKKKPDGTTGVLHDGTRVVKRFGQWKDQSNPNVNLDPSHYPEIANDNVKKSIEQYA